MTVTVEHILRNLDNVIERNEREIASWTERLKLNPTYELGWMNDIFVVAAEVKFAREAAAFLRGEINPEFTGDRIETIREEWTRDVLYEATKVPSSTSATANLMENAERAAKAKLLRDYFRVR